MNIDINTNIHIEINIHFLIARNLDIRLYSYQQQYYHECQPEPGIKTEELAQ